MRKITMLILLMVIGYGLKAQTPNVTINVTNVQKRVFSASFTKNTDCIKYKFLADKASTMQNWAQQLNVTIDKLVGQWGVLAHSDTSFTWNDNAPNTEYTIYALAYGASDTILYTTTVTTLQAGGNGIAKINVAVSEITDSSARLISVPDSNTAFFFNGIVKASLVNEIGIDSTVSLLIKVNAQYPQYETDNWVWQNLDAGTDFLAIAIGKNALSQWGDTTIVPFRTAGNSSLIEIEKEDGVKIYPNISNGIFELNNDNFYPIMMIYDIEGRLVASKNIYPNRQTINLQNLDNGMYFVALNKIGKSPISSKIIIQK